MNLQNSCLEKSPKIILGIDPGTIVMGYGILSVNGSALQMLEMNVLKLKSTQDNYSRLHSIFEKVNDLIKQYQPDCFAIEAPFFGKNVQSMLKLGRAQGVAIAAAIAAGLEVCEYSPRKIKQSITGNGNAEKEQVWKMLQHILKLQESTTAYLDASDALAVAVCHHFQGNAVKVKTPAKVKSWKEFININPGKVR